MTQPRRVVLLYTDKAGRSEVGDEIKNLKDTALQVKIRKKLRNLSDWKWEDLLSSEAVKLMKGADEIYELRLAGKGPWGQRLFFFRSKCKPDTYVVTELEARRRLNRAGAFDAAISRAERFREDWERRNCEDT